MEPFLIATAIVIVSSLAVYGYYRISLEKIEDFERRRDRKTAYRTNEEFVQS